MKTFIKKIFWILWLFFLLSSFCNADIIFENTHFVKRCVKIIKNPKLKDTTLVYKITWPMVEDPSEGNIEYNTCLHKWYKFNQFELFVQKNGEKIPLWNIQTRRWYVSDTNPLMEENISYKVVNTWWKYKLQEISSSKKYLYTSFWKYLLLTIIIEILVLFAFKKALKLDVGYKRIIFAGIVASSLTFPVLWFFKDIGTSLFASFQIYTLVWEISVILVETILLKYILKISWKHAVIFSIFCNIISYTIWLFI